MIFLHPGTGFLYLGSTGFDGIHGMDDLWFRLFRYDPSTLPSISNWENYSIPSDEFLSMFEAAFFSLYKFT